MAQLVNIEGVGVVSFPDGMTQDEMAAALSQLPGQRTVAQDLVRQVGLTSRFRLNVKYKLQIGNYSV